MVRAKSRVLLAAMFALGGCAASGTHDADAPAAPPVTASPSATPDAPAERSIFAEVLGPLQARLPVPLYDEWMRDSGVDVQITVALSGGRQRESVTAAVPVAQPNFGEPVVVRGESGWRVALAAVVASESSCGAMSTRVAFDVSWTRPDGPPRFPALPADAPRGAAPPDGSAGEVQFALQGTLTSGLRSSRVVEWGRPTALATIALGQETATFTITFAPITGPARRVSVVACDEHVAARLREILAADEPASPGSDVRTIELVTDDGDPAGFVCGTDATPGSRFASARPRGERGERSAPPSAQQHGEFGGAPHFAAADLSAPGSAAYLVRDAAWVTDYELRDGRVAPVVTRRRSGFVWLRDVEGLTLSESVVLRSTTPRPVTLADGRTLWADVLRAEPGPRVVTSDAMDDAFVPEVPMSRR